MRPVASLNHTVGLMLRLWPGHSGAPHPALRRATVMEEPSPLARGAAAAILTAKPALTTTKATGKAGACRLGVARTLRRATSTSAALAHLTCEVVWLINRKVLPTWMQAKCCDELPDLLA